MTCTCPPETWQTSLRVFRQRLVGEASLPRRRRETLVIAPLLAGNPAVYTFVVDAVPHYLVVGEGGV